jgi:hypothetical protein
MILKNSDEFIFFVKSNIKYTLGVDWCIRTIEDDQYIILSDNTLLTIFEGDFKTVLLEEAKYVLKFPCEVEDVN